MRLCQIHCLLLFPIESNSSMRVCSVWLHAIAHARPQNVLDLTASTIIHSPAICVTKRRTRISCRENDLQLSRRSDMCQSLPMTASGVVLSKYVPVTRNSQAQATYNRYARASRSGTRLDQVLLPAAPKNPHGLQRVVMASYDVEIEWLESLVPESVPVTYIGNPPRGTSTATVLPGLYTNDANMNWEMCVPHKPHGRALQHMKFLLLFFNTHLRVVVSTGNLTRLDWSRYENVCLLHANLR